MSECAPCFRAAAEMDEVKAFVRKGSAEQDAEFAVEGRHGGIGEHLPEAEKMAINHVERSLGAHAAGVRPVVGKALRDEICAVTAAEALIKEPDVIAAAGA